MFGGVVPLLNSDVALADWNSTSHFWKRSYKRIVLSLLLYSWDLFSLSLLCQKLLLNALESFSFLHTSKPFSFDGNIRWNWRLCWISGGLWLRCRGRSYSWTCRWLACNEPPERITKVAHSLRSSRSKGLYTLRLFRLTSYAVYKVLIYKALRICRIINSLLHLAGSNARHLVVRRLGGW